MTGRHSKTVPPIVIDHQSRNWTDICTPDAIFNVAAVFTPL